MENFVETQNAAKPILDDLSEYAKQEIKRRAFRPFGGGRELFACKEKEVVIHGPAGTGKSRTALEKLYNLAQKYPGMRGAIVRRFRSTITQAAMVTFEKLVCLPGDGVKFNTVEQEYRFPNGSAIVVAGLDDPTKVLSTEFDIIYVQECTEIDEATWEVLTTRLRWGRMPYQQLLGDCNPAAKKHWIIKRDQQGKLKMIQSTHKDNPMLWDQDIDDWTEAGKDYMSKLQSLTGFMRERLYLGNWVGAEGLVYTEYDYNVNLMEPFTIPIHWTRYVGIDWGYKNPLTIQWWAEDHDGRLYLYRELYVVENMVEDVAHQFFELSQGETYRAIICDQDAEDRATFERHAGHSADECIRYKEKDFTNVPKRFVSTYPADKSKNSIRAGIEKVQNRLKPAGDGHPRLFILKNCLVAVDTKLDDAKKPTCLLDEIDDYIWDKIESSRIGEKILEVPRKINDHGCDVMRYVVMFVDALDTTVPASVWGSRTKNTYSAEKSNNGEPVDILWGKTKESFWR